MEVADYIETLRKQNSNALTFIPFHTLQERYVTTGQYLLIPKRGFLLHGTGIDWHITNACIEYDFRQRGHGMDMVAQLVERAKQHNVRRILLSCAEDLEANAFWLACGFEHIRTIDRANRRNRRKFQYELSLWPKLI